MTIHVLIISEFRTVTGFFHLCITGRARAYDIQRPKDSFRLTEDILSRRLHTDPDKIPCFLVKHLEAHPSRTLVLSSKNTSQIGIFMLDREVAGSNLALRPRWRLCVALSRTTTIPCLLKPRQAQENSRRLYSLE